MAFVPNLIKFTTYEIKAPNQELIQELKFRPGITKNSGNSVTQQLKNSHEVTMKVKKSQELTQRLEQELASN